MALELVLLDTVKNAMDMPISETDKDAILTQIIRGVSANFEKMTGRFVDITAYSEVFDVKQFTRDLKLKAWPIDTAQSFTIWHDLDRGFAAGTEVDASFYYIDAEKGIVDLFQRYPVSRKTLKVSYTGGMAKMTSPPAGEEFWNLFPDIAEAVIFEVIEQYKTIPNLGSEVVRVGSDWTQMFPRRVRSPQFKQVVVDYSRVIV